VSAQRGLLLRAGSACWTTRVAKPRAVHAPACPVHAIGGAGSMAETVKDWSDLDAVRRLIEADAGWVHQPVDEDGNLPLHAVAAAGCWSALGVLLDAGARPGTRNKHDAMVVEVGVQAGYAIVVSTLLRHPVWMSMHEPTMVIRHSTRPRLGATPPPCRCCWQWAPHQV